MTLREKIKQTNIELCWCMEHHPKDCECNIDELVALFTSEMKKIIGEDEEAGDTVVKTLTLTALEAATKALEFHARNELRAEQRKRWEEGK